MSQINLNRVLNHPLSESDWPHLQTITKMMHEYINKCIKNREYIEAQKAKDKIAEAQQNIKRRKISSVNNKLQITIKELKMKHNQQKQLLMQDWDTKISQMDKKLTEMIKKKKLNNSQERNKLQQQIQLALPIHHSPDDKLKALRHQQKQYASIGNFIEAQRVKEQIQQRQLYLQQKHKQLRKTNIQQMLAELDEKHKKDTEDKEKNKRHVLLELEREKTKKLKQLEFNQTKEVKEVSWIFNEEARLAGS